MTKIRHIDTLVTEDLHKDFRLALAINGQTGKDALSDLVALYVEATKTRICALYGL